MRREKGRFWTKYDKVQQAEPTEAVSNLDGSLYAILFNANEGPHSHDLRLAYHSLIDAGASDGTIWEKDFEQMMQDLPTNFGLFYFAQCYLKSSPLRVSFSTWV